MHWLVSRCLCDVCQKRSMRAPRFIASSIENLWMRLKQIVLDLSVKQDKINWCEEINDWNGKNMTEIDNHLLFNSRDLKNHLVYFPLPEIVKVTWFNHTMQTTLVHKAILVDKIFPSQGKSEKNSKCLKSRYLQIPDSLIKSFLHCVCESDAVSRSMRTSPNSLKIF